MIRHCEALANTVEGYFAASLGVTQGHDRNQGHQT